MNTTYKSERSMLLAVLAVVALSVVVVGAIADTSDAKPTDTSIYGNSDLPVRTIDFDVTLGYESYKWAPAYYFNYVADEFPDDAFFYNVTPYSQFWTASFDFSNSIPEGKYWPYGNNAVIAVTFFFEGGADGLGSYTTSKTICYPVFEVNGCPYVEDVICTPDLWPTDGSSVYPVQVEAIIYSPLYNDTGVNNQV